MSQRWEFGRHKQLGDDILVTSVLLSGELASLPLGFPLHGAIARFAGRSAVFDVAVVMADGEDMGRLTLLSKSEIEL